MEKEYNPDDSIIRLNEYEYHFVKEYYPDVDPDHLLLPAFGLSSVTNMDFLESSLKYDIENQVLDRYPDPLHALGMMIDIKRKIDAYKTRPVL